MFLSILKLYTNSIILGFCKSFDILVEYCYFECFFITRIIPFGKSGISPPYLLLPFSTIVYESKRQMSRGKILWQWTCFARDTLESSIFVRNIRLSYQGNICWKIDFNFNIKCYSFNSVFGLDSLYFGRILLFLNVLFYTKHSVWEQRNPVSVCAILYKLQPHTVYFRSETIAWN